LDRLVEKRSDKIINASKENKLALKKGNHLAALFYLIKSVFTPN